jgi:hypothetical protein
MPMHRYWAGPELAVTLTTVTNEAVAAHGAGGAGRLYGLGTLPLQHPGLAVRELERAMTELGLKGVSVSTNVDGRELADPAFDPVWEAAAGLGAVVFVHPWGCSLGARLGAHFLYPFDMGVTDPVERAAAAALPAADLTAILSGNAAALLGLNAREAQPRRHGRPSPTCRAARARAWSSPWGRTSPSSRPAITRSRTCAWAATSSTACGSPASRCYGASCPGLVSASAAWAAVVVAAVLRSSEKTPPG